jgi:ABC-type sugar transport system permease subunit
MILWTKMTPGKDFCPSSLQHPINVCDSTAELLQINSEQYKIFNITHIGPKQYVRNIIMYVIDQQYHFLSVLRYDQKQRFFALFEKFTKNEITNAHYVNIPSDRS